MSEITQLSNLKNAQSRESLIPQVQTGFFNLQSFELIQRIAKGFSASTLVPKEYQNNVGNCMIALNLAQRIGGDPLMVMQNLVVIHGRPTWSAQFLLATANTCGRFSAIRFEFFGEKDSDSWGCRAWAVEHSTGEKLVGADVTIAIAKKEGWYGKNGSKWQSIPQQMLMYRAGSWWVRAYSPELSMGLMTAEEVVDTFNAQKDESGNYSVNIDELRPEIKESLNPDTGEITETEREKVIIESSEPSPEEQAKIQAQLIAEAAADREPRKSRSSMNLE